MATAACPDKVGFVASTVQLFVCTNSSLSLPQASIYFHVRVCVFLQSGASVITPSFGYPVAKVVVLHTSVTVGSTKAGTTLQMVPVIVTWPNTVGLVTSTVHVFVCTNGKLSFPQASTYTQVLCWLLVQLAPSVMA